MRKAYPYIMCLVAILLAAAFMLVQCGGGSTNPSSDSAKWTIIGYLDGNNDLDNSQNNTSYVISDIHEMEEIGSTDDVQVIVMLGCLKTGGLCKYYHIEQHTSEMPDSVSSTVLEDMGTKDMSDPTSLKDFVKYCVDNYPAEHYMLVIDDHGGGWRGACVDEQNGAGDMMTLPEIRSALTYSDAPKFDIIVFHACLMSMVEVAYELKGCSNYMAACQFTMPMESVLGSQEWLGGLKQDPDLSAYELGQNIVDAVYNAGQNKGKLIHMALTDLSKVTDLSANIATLGNHLITETGDYWSEVSHAWGETHYTQYDDEAFVDLREFVKKVLQEDHLKENLLISADANTVIDAVNAAVPYTKTNVAGLTRGGLCIHFPFRESDFDSANYVKTAFRATNWHNFLSEFIKRAGGSTNQQAQVSGTVTWAGHTLSANAIAFLDSSHSNDVYIVSPTAINRTTGAYTITITLQTPLEVFVEAWDNLNGDGYIDQGEGFGFYDANGNGDWDDMFTLSPGQTLTGVNITLSTVTRNRVSLTKD